MQRIIIQVTDDQYDTLRRLAYEQHTPMTAIVRDALETYLKTEDKPRKQEEGKK